MHLYGAVCVVGVVVLALGAGGAPAIQSSNMAAFSRSLFGGNGLGLRSPNLCTHNDHQRYMCEMCSKETKSSQVYALCCMGADDAQTWCQSFLVYGINGV